MDDKKNLIDCIWNSRLASFLYFTTIKLIAVNICNLHKIITITLTVSKVSNLVNYYLCWSPLSVPHYLCTYLAKLSKILGEGN